MVYDWLRTKSGRIVRVRYDALVFIDYDQKQFGRSQSKKAARSKWPDLATARSYMEIDGFPWSSTSVTGATTSQGSLASRI